MNVRETNSASESGRRRCMLKRDEKSQLFFCCGYYALCLALLLLPCISFDPPWRNCEFVCRMPFASFIKPITDKYFTMASVVTEKQLKFKYRSSSTTLDISRKGLLIWNVNVCMIDDRKERFRDWVKVVHQLEWLLGKHEDVSLYPQNLI